MQEDYLPMCRKDISTW